MDRYTRWIGKRQFERTKKDSVIKDGNLIELGRHTLLCGDGCSPENAAKVTNGQTPETLVFDPEFDDIPIIAPLKENLIFFDNSCHKTIFEVFGTPHKIFVWDPRRKTLAGRSFLQQAKFCAWYSTAQKYKNRFRWGTPTNRSMGIQKTSRGTPTIVGQTNALSLSDLFTMSSGKSESGQYWHGHSKPWPWIAMLIANCTHGIVFDPFAGGGTSLIACERIGRICCAIELDPKRCERIIDRYLLTFSRDCPECRINGTQVDWRRYKADGNKNSD